jgi:anaerobic magnesium-protoporphyrin IX monomethyl ester cyclase
VADILLTHSYHLAYDPKQVRKMQPYPPLGTLYAASALRMAGISVAVFDPMLQNPWPAFAGALKQHNPRIVVIYEDDFNFLSKMCLTKMRELATQLATLAQAAGAIVVAHGSDASDHAAEYLFNGVNYILLGEAEDTLTELCSTLLLNEEPHAIAGLLHLDPSRQLVMNGLKPPANHRWINLPGPARELIDLEPYRKAWTEAHGYFSINMVASRGCPYRCNWCAKPISGNKFQVRPAERVAAEIRDLKDLYGVQHIWFGDDIFALNHHWIEDFATAMEAKSAVLPFKIQTRADLMTEATVSALRRAGCTEVWMGVESGSQHVLDAMGKGLQVAEVRTARELLAGAGIRACYFLQFGYPGETWEDIQQTVELVRSSRPYDVGISLSYPLPGTIFYEQVRSQLGSKRNWMDSDDLCLMFKAAYTDQFYRALRDAIHAEVNSWRATFSSEGEEESPTAIWQNVIQLEAVSRNSEVTVLHRDNPGSGTTPASQFVPLEHLVTSSREI